MTKRNGWKIASGLFLFVVAISSAPAQTFTTLATFDATNGEFPSAALVQGRDGNFYGTTSQGFGGGSIFRITPSGKLTTIGEFNAPAFPNALLLASDGEFYGTTQSGGNSQNCPFSLGCGTVFEISPGGKLTTLYSFCSQADCGDGSSPFAGLIQATNGNFYGTTTFGGIDGAVEGYGTVFEITPAGKLSTLYSFCAQPKCADGSYPDASLVQAANGNFYGTTFDGGAHVVYGTIFEITPAGKLTTLYSFCSQPNCSDGGQPVAGLVQATNGNLYGTTETGGLFGYGTIFEISPAGQLTILYSFCALLNCADGANPFAGLVQATDGNLYGTTRYGGTNGDGTIFDLTSAVRLTTLYSFCSQPDCADGASPLAGLLQATNGNFYGTTANGGGTECFEGCGTVFRLSVGLGQFVTFVRAAGKVGQTGGILGQGFTGTAAVSINGVPANFKVVSDTYLTATVPQGATTGYVTVTTPTGVLTSNVPFRVIP